MSRESTGRARGWRLLRVGLGGKKQKEEKPKIVTQPRQQSPAAFPRTSRRINLQTIMIVPAILGLLVGVRSEQSHSDGVEPTAVCGAAGIISMWMPAMQGK